MAGEMVNQGDKKQFEHLRLNWRALPLVDIQRL
jgi:hypothetical protein